MGLDGAGWHRAGNLRVPANMHLMFLPPYGPKLNPVEPIWKSIRENRFPKAVFKNVDGVENQPEKALAALESGPDAVARLTGFPWIRWYQHARTLVLNAR